MGKEVIWPPFLCPKMVKNGNGVTIGVTDMGLHFRKLGVTHSGFSGVG